MRIFASSTNAKGELTYLSADFSYDEVVSVLVEAGLVPEGMEATYWRGDLNGLTIEMRRPEPQEAGPSESVK